MFNMTSNSFGKRSKDILELSNTYHDVGWQDWQGSSQALISVHIDIVCQNRGYVSIEGYEKREKGVAKSKELIWHCVCIAKQKHNSNLHQIFWFSTSADICKWWGLWYIQEDGEASWSLRWIAFLCICGWLCGVGSFECWQQQSNRGNSLTYEEQAICDVTNCNGDRILLLEDHCTMAQPDFLQCVIVHCPTIHTFISQTSRTWTMHASRSMLTVAILVAGLLCQAPGQ